MARSMSDHEARWTARRLITDEAIYQQPATISALNEKNLSRLVSPRRAEGAVMRGSSTVIGQTMKSADDAKIPFSAGSQKNNLA